jgi:FkbM family methyltransferase
MAKICRSSIVENVAVYSKDCMLTFQANKHTTRENEPGIPVKATTLTNLFKKHNIPNVIDYVSMDIEGSEYDALLGFP